MKVRWSADLEQSEFYRESQSVMGFRSSKHTDERVISKHVTVLRLTCCIPLLMLYHGARYYHSIEN